MKRHLLIKGGLADAQAALDAHGMQACDPPEELDSQLLEKSVSVIVADVTDDRLIVWYLEPPEHPPFPAGTLLYYGPTKGTPV